MKKKYKDTLIKGFTNVGKELDVYCDKDFVIGSQLLFLDEADGRYHPLTIKGIYNLKRQKTMITTDKNGFILSSRRQTNLYKLNTLGQW